MTRNLRFAIIVLLTSFAALLFSDFSPAAAQTCRWGSSVAVPPSSTALRSYRDLLHSPTRVAVDGAGYVYVTDPRVGAVVVRDPYGRLASTVEGLNVPMGIAVDRDGRIYVGEQGNGRVTVFDRNWNILYFLGRGDGEFLLPNDIAIDFEYGWIYVSDSDAHVIKVYAPADGASLFSFGGKGPGAGQFDFPAGVYLSLAGEVFVADQNNDRIQVLDRSGNFLRCIGGAAFSFSKKFGRIQGLTGDSLGRLYVADAFQGYVQVLDASGYRLSTIGTFGEGPGELRTPMDVAIDSYNRLIVTSANNSRVELFGIDSFTDPHVIPAVVDIQPEPWNRFASGETITAYIEIRGESLEQIDPTSITANGVPALRSPVVIADYNANGIPDLMITFDARAILVTIPDGDPIIIVSGAFLNGNPLEGADTVHVFSQPIPAVVDIQPDTLKRSANRDTIAAYIEIRNESLDQIDITSIAANGVPALLSPVTIGDYDADGIPDLPVKFDAQAILAALADGDSVMIVSGRFLNGNRFEGSDAVRVISSK